MVFNVPGLGPAASFTKKQEMASSGGFNGPNQDGGHNSDSIERTTSFETFDKGAERRLRTKIDLHLVPVMCLIYLFAFIDRANIGKNPKP